MTVRGVAIAVVLIVVLLGGGWLWLQPAAGLAAGGASDAAANGTVTVSVDAVNYMHDWDVQFTLIDTRSNAPVGGGRLSGCWKGRVAKVAASACPPNGSRGSSSGWNG